MCSARVLRSVVGCAECSLCARAFPIGFATEPYLVCTARDAERVTEWDGCTLGEPGAPMPAIEANMEVSVDREPEPHDA